MSKPLVEPTWASDVNYPAGAEPEAGTPTKVASTVDDQALGARPAQLPTAQRENYWRNLVWLWIAYLNAGALEGDFSITGNLTVTGSVKGSTLLYTDEDTLQIPAGTANAVPSGPTWQTGVWSAGVTTGQLWYPIPTVVGMRIKSWLWFHTKNSASGTITATLVKVDSFTRAVSNVGTPQTHAGAGAGNDTLIENGLDELVAADTVYYLIVTGGGLTGDTFGDLQVNVTRPAVVV